ncbi:unnamed protein product [Bursaphelenchus xylophilus]|uniref:(pine wood nematode) hypothetical protein n=1 Tax=Bursaphelenchus xylophilus TaxID=6326 RepID=A0A811KYS3_BURXY|nr:unnamed protein product [Bursaphelenchus xylophilus]CAG9105986.1 unnamed protein product [Bursaphelenchus xylophilus]
MEFVKESAMSSSPISNICLTERQMQLSMDGVERVLIGYALPFVVIFGITGNLFNLTVLLTPSMRSRSNIFLAALAVADMLFLFLMFPHSLVHFDLFLFNYYFRLFYLSGTTYLLTLANWASAAAIWLILTICVERLIGIRYPLSTRKRSNCSIPAIIAVIVFVTGVLTAYNLFSHECVLRVFCNDTQVHGYCLEIAKELWPKNRQNPHSVLRKAYALWSPRFNAVFVVFLPTLVIVMSNALLIQTLHKRRKFLQDSTRNHSEEGQTLAAAGNNAGTNCQSRNEQRITLTICAIVTCFTLTQAPSAFYHLLKITLEPSHGRLPIGTITNFMVCVGKSLNFLLFCMSSSSFRNKFMKLTKNRLNVAMGKKLLPSKTSKAQYLDI